MMNRIFGLVLTSNVLTDKPQDTLSFKNDTVVVNLTESYINYPNSYKSVLTSSFERSSINNGEVFYKNSLERSGKQ